MQCVLMTISWIPHHPLRIDFPSTTGETFLPLVKC